MRLIHSIQLLLTVGVAASPALQHELSFHGRRALDSGPDYYELRQGADGEYLHAEFRPGDAAVKEGIVLPETERRGHFALTWRWRALTLPVGGNDCEPTKTDSAA